MKTKNKNQYIHFGERACSVLYWFLKSISNHEKYFMLPTNICPDVYFTFKKAGFNIVWCDLELDNLNLDLEKNSYLIRNRKVSGLLYNHTYGNEFTPYNKFMEFKGLNPQLYIIDDRCLCMPNLEFDNISENIDLVLYSTSKKKQIDLGFGGYGICHQNLCKIRDEFNSKDYDSLVEEFSGNCLSKSSIDFKIKSNWLNSNILKISSDKYMMKIIDYSEKIRSHKNEIINIYRKVIPNEFQYDEKFQNWRFNINCSNRNLLMRLLNENGLFAGIHYRSLGTYLENKSFPIAEDISEKIINLFVDFNYTIDKAKATAQLIRKYAALT